VNVKGLCFSDPFCGTKGICGLSGLAEGEPLIYLK
jgi:hypothetical protein